MATPAPQVSGSPFGSVFRAWEDGHAALLIGGRSVYDLDTDGQGKLRPLHELLRGWPRMERLHSR
jgi:hypothetical protein